MAETIDAALEIMRIKIVKTHREEVYALARQPNIRFLMKSKLNSFEAYGEKKHDYKLSTQKKREALKENGASYEESLKVNDYKEKIFSYNTMKIYQNEISKYADWLESQDLKKCSWDEAKDRVQEYISELELTKSAWSTHTSLAALCKTFGTNMFEYDHAKRKLCDIKRGVSEAKNDKKNEKACKDILDANSVLGLRRNELKHLRVSDFKEVEIAGRTVLAAYYKGKGGKDCVSYYIDEYSQAYIRNLLKNKSPDELVFKKQMNQFKYDCDLHSRRALAARNMYQYLVEHEDEKAFYREILTYEFAKRGKDLPDNLDKPYKLRGDNKRAHEAAGLPTEIDREAALAVSCFLNHYRESVSINHYLVHF